MIDKLREEIKILKGKRTTLEHRDVIYWKDVVEMCYNLGIDATKLKPSQKNQDVEDKE